ncbi:MAG: SAM-dependent methyltransferase, partial [Pirellulaceae bacterium]
MDDTMTTTSKTTTKTTKAPSKLARVWSSIRQQGIVPIVRRNFWRWWWHRIEQKHSLDTGGSIDGAELGVAEDGFGYQPIDVHSFHLAISKLDIDWSRSVFADYGCGKGRAVLLAGRRPFKKVLGIEICLSLCRIAEANVAAAKALLSAQDVEIIETDATTFEPPSDLNVVFMYNPFDANIVQLVLERLRESLAAHPRDMQIIY